MKLTFLGGSGGFLRAIRSIARTLEYSRLASGCTTASTSLALGQNLDLAARSIRASSVKACIGTLAHALDTAVAHTADSRALGGLLNPAWIGATQDRMNGPVGGCRAPRACFAALSASAMRDGASAGGGKPPGMLSASRRCSSATARLRGWDSCGMRRTTRSLIVPTLHHLTP